MLFDYAYDAVMEAQRAMIIKMRIKCASKIFVMDSLDSLSLAVDNVSELVQQKLFDEFMES